jgi:hypothetical protein
MWYGMVWYGMVWYGMVWYDMVRYGMIRHGGMVWYYGMVCCSITKRIGTKLTKNLYPRKVSDEKFIILGSTKTPAIVIISKGTVVRV